LIGRLAVDLPADMAEEERKPEPAELNPPEKIAPVLPETPPKTAAVKPKRAKKIAPPDRALFEEETENGEAPVKTGRDGMPENAGNLARLNKNAARKAYGGAAARTSAPKNGKTSGE
jgi:hypothetical protein